MRLLSSLVLEGESGVVESFQRLRFWSVVVFGVGVVVVAEVAASLAAISLALATASSADMLMVEWLWVVLCCVVVVVVVCWLVISYGDEFLKVLLFDFYFLERG